MINADHMNITTEDGIQEVINFRDASVPEQIKDFKKIVYCQTYQQYLNLVNSANAEKNILYIVKENIDGNEVEY